MSKLVVKDFWGNTYLFELQKKNTTLAPIEFLDTISASRFLRNFAFPPGFVRYVNVISQSNEDWLSTVAQQLSRGGINVYRLYGKQAIPLKIKKASYQIVEPALLSSSAFKKAKKVKDRDQIEEIINKLEGDKDTKEKLKSGKLVVVKLAAPKPPKAKTSQPHSEGLETVEELPGVRDVNLGPPPKPEKTLKGWIEITMLHANETPLKNQTFELTDAKGNKHSGTTNSEGIAKIDNIAEGKCDIAFPALSA